MTSITRRTALTRIVSAPAALAAGTGTAAAMAAQPAEHRQAADIARELADAMVGFCADLGGRWKAVVYPANTMDRPVQFVNTEALQDTALVDANDIFEAKFAIYVTANDKWGELHEKLQMMIPPTPKMPDPPAEVVEADRVIYAKFAGIPLKDKIVDLLDAPDHLGAWRREAREWHALALQEHAQLRLRLGTEIGEEEASLEADRLLEEATDAMNELLAIPAETPFGVVLKPHAYDRICGLNDGGGEVKDMFNELFALVGVRRETA